MLQQSDKWFGSDRSQRDGQMQSLHQAFRTPPPHRTPKIYFVFIVYDTPTNREKNTI